MKPLSKDGTIETFMRFGIGRNTGMAQVDCGEAQCDWTTEEGRDDLSAIAAAIHRQYPHIVHVQFTLAGQMVGEMMFMPNENRMH